ncbi:MAG: tRNA epoxyqueuosine(34) reductase QueG [Flavobacteriaceae bacterium]|nr:tRNA epoxyqueuosine(34) reductase QueG [Flavobacteriaceae bacterium]
MTKARHTQLLKEEAQRLGFLSCGISKAVFLEAEAPRLEQWLRDDRHGKMGYMANHFDKRLDPTLLVPDAKSVISLLFNYFPEAEQQDPEAPKFAKYAYGTDYHFVLKDKLKQLFQYLEEEIGTINGRVFVDSAPVMEKAWAAKSGLGWVGKNTNLIAKSTGSFFFITEIICDLEFDYDGPATDHCGSCTACIDACPTEALTPYQIDASKCISYLTIELKDEIPSEFQGKMDNWAFGCDVCQTVCPWNRFSQVHQEPAFQPKEELLTYTAKDWEEITRETFDVIFKKSPVKRTGFDRLKQTFRFLR